MILKRLMCLIKQIERGWRTTYIPSRKDGQSLYDTSLRALYDSDQSSDKRLQMLSVPNKNSYEYPWGLNDNNEPDHDEKTPSVDFEDEDLAQSVKLYLDRETFSTYKPHHYFDYIGGTSTGG
jgi:patatin-like phospholipase/acyl hydrolase